MSSLFTDYEMLSLPTAQWLMAKAEQVPTKTCGRFETREEAWQWTVDSVFNSSHPMNRWLYGREIFEGLTKEWQAKVWETLDRVADEIYTRGLPRGGAK